MGLWTYALSKQKGADADVVAGIRKRTSAGGACDCGANAEESVSRKPAEEGLCVGIERSGCELRDGIAGGEGVGTRSGVCGERAGRSSLLAGTQCVFTFVGDTSWDESVPAPAPPAKRSGQECRALARIAVGRSECRATRRCAEEVAARAAAGERSPR